MLLAANVVKKKLYEAICYALHDVLQGIRLCIRLYRNEINEQKQD